MGRPSNYTPEIAALICSRMADGQSLRKVCLADDMPDKSTVFRWLGIHKVFQDQYARAMDSRSDCFAEEILEIADDGRNDTFKDEEGHESTDHDVIARSRLRVDTRKWLMARMSPKKYGDRVEQVQTGDPEKPVVTKIVREIIRPEKREGDG